MKNIDRLLKEAKLRCSTKPVQTYGVHIVEDGYCYSCKGSCRYIRDDNYQVLVDDIVAIEVHGEVKSFEGVPRNTLIKLVNLE